MFAILQKCDFSSKSQRLNGLPFGASSCLRYYKSAIFQANHKWLSLPTYGEWWCAWPSPPAVGHGRCVGYLFGTHYLFLLEILVVTNKAVSLQCISNGVGTMSFKASTAPRSLFCGLILFLLFSHRKSRRSLFCHFIILSVMQV